MKVRRVGAAGHCFGVKAAMELAFETARNAHGPVYTLGPIIHNAQAVQQLEAEGVRAVNNLSEVSAGVIIIRSHGVAPQVIAEATARGLSVVDATCPFVRRAQNQARELVQNGYSLVIVGEASHPEVEGILGTVNGQAQVVSGPDEVAALPHQKRYGLIAQTTQSLENLQRVASALLTRTSTLKVQNTICHATIDLQRETRSLAAEMQVMLVVGGRNSANTSRLVRICETVGVTTHHIETAAEVDPAWFAGVERVGVTAGTSTPDWIIAEVIQHLEALPSESAPQHG